MGSIRALFLGTRTLFIRERTARFQRRIPSSGERSGPTNADLREREAIGADAATERQASAGARDGVKGKRNDLAARAPLHALVRPPRFKVKVDLSIAGR